MHFIFFIPIIVPFISDTDFIMIRFNLCIAVFFITVLPFSAFPGNFETSNTGFPPNAIASTTSAANENSPLQDPQTLKKYHTLTGSIAYITINIQMSQTPANLVHFMEEHFGKAETHFAEFKQAFERDSTAFRAPFNITLQPLMDAIETLIKELNQKKEIAIALLDQAQRKLQQMTQNQKHDAGTDCSQEPPTQPHQTVEPLSKANEKERIVQLNRFILETQACLPKFDSIITRVTTIESDITLMNPITIR